MSISIKLKGFEEVMNNLDRLSHAFDNNNTMQIGLSLDVEGYLDRECPNTECLRLFKVNKDDYEKIEKLHCPYCNYATSSHNEWFTKEQAMLINKHMKKEFLKVIETYGNHKLENGLSIPAQDLLRSKEQCKKCHCRYSYVGTNTYCPSCGDVKINYSEQLTKIKQNIEVLKLAIKSLDVEVKQNIWESTIENSLKEIVEIFQANATRLFRSKDSETILRKNLFQNLSEGSKIWKNSIYNKDYKSILGKEKYGRLSVIFQKRHILVHNQGIIDQDYIKNTGESSSKLGMKVIISEKDIFNGVAIALELLEALESISI